MKQTVNGNTTGIRESVLQQIEALYELAAGQDQLIGQDLIEQMALLTTAINREISVYIRRNGTIADVSVGNSANVSLPEMRVVRNETRLCGVRCIHTHPKGGARLSDVDIGTLKSMKLDCMAAIGVQEGRATAMYAAFIGEWNEETGYDVCMYGPLRVDRLPHAALMRELYAADERLRSSTHEVAEARPERAILVGLERQGGGDDLRELGLLAETAGAEVAGYSLQKRQTPDNATYVGSGKVDELRLMGSAQEADLYIFDEELTVIQLRNLEDALMRPVIDRTALILDIFAKRALTREGRLQVELAQLRYRLPRLLGMGRVLSRLGAGIGTRGPGEKKLEIDRRRIRRRIYELEEALKEIVKQRALRREQREKNAVPLVALVGYTNAGKSTLLNAITGSDALAEDKLFATLDPVVRQAALPEGTSVLFSDTVGFIRKLPHDLIRAFRATLEEVQHADLILHVVDSANEDYDQQMKVVEETLCELGAADTPRINVYNQIDKPGALPAKRGEWAHISAKTGAGIPVLLEKIEKKLNEAQSRISLTIPYDKYEALNILRQNGRILEEEHGEEGVRIVAMVAEKDLWKIKSAL